MIRTVSDIQINYISMLYEFSSTCHSVQYICCCYIVNAMQCDVVYFQYPSENFQVEICVLSNNLKIFRRDEVSQDNFNYGQNY